MKPTFFFYNIGGEMLGIQTRIQSEGFKTVAYYTPDVYKDCEKPGKGLIECVDDPFDVINDFLDHPDDLIIILDDNSQGSLCDFLRSKGFPVVGSSECSDKHEHERGTGNKVASKIGMSVPKTHEFTDFSSGYGFLQQQEETDKFVFKPDGSDLAGGAKTYPAKNLSDVERFMQWVEHDQGIHNYIVDKFELQEVVDGVEVDVASWFNGSEFSDIATITFEQKKLDGLGSATGCYGQVLTFMPLQDPYKGYFNELKSHIEGSGPNEWALNAIVDHQNKKPHFLEFTPRLGWDSTFGELSLLCDAGIKLSEFFIRLAYGRNPIKFPIGRFSAAVRLFSESPGTPGKDTCGKPLWIDPSIEDHVWLYAAKKDEDTYTITDTAFATVTACGDTPEEAVAKLYAMVNPKSGLISTPDVFYSKYIGEEVSESIKKLIDYDILSDY